VGIGIPRFAPIAAAAVCMVLSTIAITAPSVSLEGRTIWLSQSLPVTPWQVLRAKLAVHLWVGGIPALLCGVAVAAALRLPFPTAVMTVILPLLFTLLQACFGLFVNLLHPNLTWVSEMTPIKQSLGVLFSLLGGWGYAALLGIGGYFLTVPVPAWVALLALNLLTALLSLLLLRWRMNLLTLGEEEARSMGVNTRLLRFTVILCATLLTAASVAVSGMIGWVGLVIPHFCRMLFGYDYRRLIPAAALFGASFLIVVDDIARLATAGEIPLGILTAFVGAPIFLYLILTGGARRGN